MFSFTIPSPVTLNKAVPIPLRGYLTTFHDALQGYQGYWNGMKWETEIRY